MRNHDSADRCHSSCRRSAQRTEEHAGYDQHNGISAAMMTNHGTNEINDLLRNTCALHQRPRQNKERNRQKGKGIQTGKILLHHKSDRHIDHNQRRGRGKSDGNRYRNRQEEQNKHKNKHYSNYHDYATSSFSSFIFI